jgi:hypothetical protein
MYKVLECDYCGYLVSKNGIKKADQTMREHYASEHPNIHVLYTEKKLIPK